MKVHAGGRRMGRIAVLSAMALLAQEGPKRHEG